MVCFLLYCPQVTGIIDEPRAVGKIGEGVRACHPPCMNSVMIS